MKKEKIFIFICLVLLSACSPSSLDGIVIEKAADGYKPVSYTHLIRFNFGIGSLSVSYFDPYIDW